MAVRVNAATDDYPGDIIAICANEMMRDVGSLCRGGGATSPIGQFAIANDNYGPAGCEGAIITDRMLDFLHNLVR